VIRAGDPKGLELENADTIYRYVNGWFRYEIVKRLISQISSAIDGFLWSLGSCTWNAFVSRFVVMDDHIRATTRPGTPVGKALPPSSASRDLWLGR